MYFGAGLWGTVRRWEAVCTVHAAPKGVTELPLEQCYSQSITASGRRLSVKHGRSLTKGNTALVAVSEVQTSNTAYCIDQVGSDR